jgi:hypothetical protein
MMADRLSLAQMSACVSEKMIIPPVHSATRHSSGHTGWLHSREEQYVPSIALPPDSSNILTLPRSHAASIDFTSSILGPE